MRPSVNQRAAPRMKIILGENAVTQYAFLYYGEPQFDSPEAGQAHQQKFFAWMRGLGAAVVNRGMPR